MFILEESQLLEDTIGNSSVLNLYKALRQHEPNNDRTPLVDTILMNEKCISFTEQLLDFYQTNGFSITEPVTEECRFAVEQRESLFKELNLEQNDAASLALVVAATLTQLFVIDNFSGPTNSQLLESSYMNLHQVYSKLADEIDYKALSNDGSEVYHLTINSWLLRLAQLYWNFLNRMGCSRRLLELEFLVWKQRYLTIYLSIMHESSETLINELRKIQDFIFDHHLINEAKENKTQLVRFDTVELCCELIQSALLRGGITSCRKILDYASEMSGITIEHTGVLGKRTRYQHKDIPQLLIKVNKGSENQLPRVNEDKSPEDAANLPIDVKLEDDTLLPDISFVTSEGDKESTCTEQSLSIDAQLLMLSKLDFILKTEVMDESLKDEWTLAYLRSIVKSASVWPVKFKALATRSVVEKKHMRKMDRALLQLEELIKLGDQSAELEPKRLRSFYSALPLSRWQMHRLLGDISFDLCLYKNALDVYTRIEYWEGIIKCHSAMGETNKAEKIIRQELKKHETPYLYCLLGDATDDIEFYEKSWTLSKCRFARAKKSIGTYYYTRKQYDEAITHYEQAYSASPSNISILSLLAYSCLTTERYERAAECYRNITYLDDTNFLAWNNLSKAYIKLNQKERAWRTLREAIKCNFEEWKIWENFMLVSIDIGALDDVITSFHRIIDIKSAHKDDSILSALTYSIVKKSYGNVDPDFMKLLNDALKLVARVSTTTASSPRSWICYFRLLLREYELVKTASNELSKLDIDSRVSKMTKALQRATPTTTTIDTDWFQTLEKIDRVLESYDELIDCYILTLDILGPRSEVWSQWKNFKLSITNVKKTLEKKGYIIDM